MSSEGIFPEETETWGRSHHKGLINKKNIFLIMLVGMYCLGRNTSYLCESQTNTKAEEMSPSCPALPASRAVSWERLWGSTALRGWAATSRKGTWPPGEPGLTTEDGRRSCVWNWEAGGYKKRKQMSGSFMGFDLVFCWFLFIFYVSNE